jgi:hypothetical protein
VDLAEKVRRGLLFVIQRSYFDGANQADSTLYDCLTLASISGTKKQWRDFEREWIGVLKKHHADYLHLTDAIGFQRDFSRDNGWNERRRDAFIRDCVKVYGHHLAHPRSGVYPVGQFGLFPHTVTIQLKEYIRARNDNPDVPKSANEICAVQSISMCLDWATKVLKIEHVELVFDQTEPFKGHIHDRVDNRRVLKDLPGLSLIKLIREENMREIPALQAVDLLGWCVSHKKQQSQPIWQKKMLCHPWLEEIHEYEDLINPIRHATDLAHKWNLPRRKLHP